MVWNKAGSAVLIHERHFGESGRNPGQFRLPRHICSLPDGNLCISDTVNQRLQVVTPEGEFIQSIGKAGAGAGELRGPSGVTCEGGMLYVVEGGNHRVQKLALADGSPLGRAGSHGSKKNGELWCPHGVTISKGQAFVADYINGRIVVYDVSNMEHVRTFGSRGSEPGQLEYPCGIAIRGEEVYVAEYGNHRISVFTKRGNFERIIGSEGKAPGQFYQPRGLLFVRGWLVVTEPKRVSVLAPDGEVRQTVELPGAGQLWGACKDENRAYVTDIRAGQAKVFVLNIVGAQYDDGSNPTQAASNAAAQKAAEAAAKLKEWKEARAKSSKSVTGEGDPGAVPVS
jgi:DNA-binding beta-propeller fold protein YncE